MEEIKLEYYGGNGYDGVNEKGSFEVKASASKDKLFNSLSDARDYYNSLNEIKALWDLTTIPELLEAHILA